MKKLIDKNAKIQRGLKEVQKKPILELSEENAFIDHEAKERRNK